MNMEGRHLRDVTTGNGVKRDKHGISLTFDATSGGIKHGGKIEWTRSVRRTNIAFELSFADQRRKIALSHDVLGTGDNNEGLKSIRPTIIYSLEGHYLYNRRASVEGNDRRDIGIFQKNQAGWAVD